VGVRAYRLRLPEAWKGHPVFHEEKLKRYNPPTHPHQALTSDHPEPELMDDHEEYKVETIEGKQVRNGKVWYLVNWKGYSHEDDMWEPVGNLTNTR
jgi:hypothetical protein